MMLFPLIRKILKIYYLNKIVIPEFIVAYVEDKYWLVGLVITVLALLLFYISIRLMFALPQLLFEKKTVKEAVKYSLEKTRKHSWFYIWNLLWIVVKTYLFFILLLIPILASQTLMDGLTHRESLVLGMINFVLIKNFHYMALTYFLIKFVSFLTGEELEITPRRKKDHWMRWGVMGCAGIFFALEGYVYLEAPVANKPLIISHRGVSNKNGVQNTVQSLEKVSSFDDYLNKANELHQKLLIEIKTSRKDSPDMMKRFMEKYGTDLKQNGHQMQSLDYHVIDQVLAYDSQIPVYFILPYNSIFPRTKATGYTMEYSTLDENFVNKLWNTDQKLYVWTINSSESFDKSVQLGADGMITDDLEMIQDQVTIAQEDPEYTELLFKQAMEFFNF